MKGTNQGKSAMVLVLGLSIILTSSMALGFLKTEDISDKLSGFVMTMEEGLEVISTKSYDICSNVKWSDIRATGVKFTETGLDGFLQVCERLALNFGKLTVYADFEYRLLWVYSEAGNSEAYYIQFK